MTKPHLDHVGFVVADLEAALDLFERAFDLKPTAIKDKSAIGLKLALLELANVKLELIEFSQTAGEFKDILGQEPGSSHLSLEVQDMARAVDRLETSGVKLAAGFPRPGSRGPMAFTQRPTAQGLLFELFQIDSDPEGGRS
ncbi:MAG: VOC family protein [Deltaproteobacteria bacterium]|nr:VOC family protein [Deltaproteobacteria bacterium]